MDRGRFLVDNGPPAEGQSLDIFVPQVKFQINLMAQKSQGCKDTKFPF